MYTYVHVQQRMQVYGGQTCTYMYMYVHVHVCVHYILTFCMYMYIQKVMFIKLSD